MSPAADQPSTVERRLWRLDVVLEDRPGAVNRLLAVFAARGVQIVELHAASGSPATGWLVFRTTERRAAWFARIVERVDGVHRVELAAASS